MAEEMKNARAEKPAKAAKQKKEKSHKISKFFKDLKSELKKITWYSKRDTINSSIWTIIALVIFSAAIFGVNWGFSALLALIG